MQPGAWDGRGSAERTYNTPGIAKVKPQLSARNGGNLHSLMRLRGLGQRVFEVVGVLSVGDVDVQLASEADELATSGIRDDGDAEFRRATSERADVLKGESAGARAGGSMKRSGDAFDGDIAGRTFDVGGGREHLAFAGAFEIAVESFLDSHATEGGIDFVVLRREFDFEWAGGVGGHGSSLLSWGGLGGGEAHD